MLESGKSISRYLPPNGIEPIVRNFALWESYDDWSRSQTYLHIVSHHDAVDDAEAMYRRAIAFGETEELSEFHAELSDLRDQLRLIAEMEALNIRNVL